VNTDKSLLITRPEHDLTTRYLSKWSDEIVSEAEAKHFEVIDLKGEKANRERFIGTLEKKSSDFVFMNGHGNADIVGGHENAPLLEASDTGVKDKIVYARACKSAKRLGPQAVENGATAYVGYDEDFIFMYETAEIGRPLQDKTAALFLEPSNQLALSILKGHSIEEADKRSKEKYIKNIRALFFQKLTDDDQQVIRLLAWDMQHQVCLGDKNATL
jgi:hypothetical protein